MDGCTVHWIGHLRLPRTINHFPWKPVHGILWWRVAYRATVALPFPNRYPSTQPEVFLHLLPQCPTEKSLQKKSALHPLCP